MGRRIAAGSTFHLHLLIKKKTIKYKNPQLRRFNGKLTNSGELSLNCIEVAVNGRFCRIFTARIQFDHLHVGRK